MYAPAYGYGPANTSAQAQGQAHAAFNPNNPNGVSPQPQTPHQQHQHQQHQQLPGQQPQQHMMYNPQAQHAQAQAQAQAHAQAQQYAGHQPSPYGGVSAPGMGGNAGAIGMMQNNGMAQMPAAHVSTYQTPYSSSPYGGNIPTSTGANMPPNFMPTTSNAPSFPMNAQSMNPQHQAQRMQPPPSSSTPQGQRTSPFPGIQHNTPPNAGQMQSQFSTPQSNNQTHLQTPNHNQQAQGQTVVTPQTPNFPPGAGGGGPMATPLSPGSESREKERVTLLLEINNGLLKEVMLIQALQAELKKDDVATAASPEGADKEKAEKEKAEKLKAPSREYVECMRRLQSNLAYLAAIADRSHKPSSQIPPHPAIMSAPPLSPKSPSGNSTTSPKSEAKKDEIEEKKLEDSHEDQSEILKDLYKRLQALFPGVDPRKEPQIPAPNQVARSQAQQQAAAHVQTQKQQQGQSGVLDPNAQQKMQNDMLRQKMMQQQAQNQQHQQQQMGQGMQGMPGMGNQQMNNPQQGQIQSR